MHDVVVIGAGAAGFSAALYSARYKLDTLLLSKDIGGTTNESPDIANYPGFKSIPGIDLMNKMRDQVKEYGVDVQLDSVKEIKKEGEKFRIKAGSKEYEAKTVVLAVGTKHRKLNAPGEEKLSGKGVSYCATCDAPFFGDKIVGVVGAGDSAAITINMLTDYAKKIYVFIRGDKWRAEPYYVDRIKQNKKVEVMMKVDVKEIAGKDFIEGVKLSNGKEVKLEGLFVEIGIVPVTGLAKQLGADIDERGFIKVNEKQETTVGGLYAAGDATTGSNHFMQIATAISEGAIAANSVYTRLQKNG